MSRRRKLLVGLLLLEGVALLALVIWWQRGVQAPDGVGVPRGPGVPPVADGQDAPDARTTLSSVVLISIDTLRADHLGCYGHPTARTPHIDALAREGVLFEQCTSSCPLTLPSHATLLTGTYPFVHGARDNGSFHLHPDNLTVTEVLREAGFRTAAILGAFVLNREFGLDQGFESYDDVRSAEKRSEPVVPGGAAPQRIAEDVCARAIRELKTLAGKPFFLFVHFYDPHYPYDPPARWASAPGGPYVGEIAYVDEQVGRLLQELRQLGLEQSTLVVLTSDHGEGLGQHQEQTHGSYLYDTTLSVPLILRGPGVLPKGRRVPGQVRLADVAPTILDLLGRGSLPDAQGTPLAALARGSAGDPDLPAYADTVEPLNTWGYAPLHAVRQGGWKYIHAPTPQLYDLRADPGELTNLAEDQPERVAKMDAALRRIITEAPSVVGAASAQRPTTPEEVRTLAAIGYVGGSAFELVGRSELELLDLAAPDRHDDVDVVRLTTRAMECIQTGRLDEAESVLRPLLEPGRAPPAFYWGYVNMGYLLSRRGQHAEAVEYYRRGLALRADDSELLRYFAMSLTELGQTEEAKVMFARALDCRPVFPETHRSFGVALSRWGRLDEALAQFRAALALEPENAGARQDYVQLCLGSGRVGEAIAELERGVAAQPDVPQIRGMLVDLLLRENRVAEARAQLAQMLQRWPEQAPAHAQLGQACLQAGAPAEAEPHFRRALELDKRLAPAWRSLAQTYLRLGRPADALRTYQAGQASNPNDAGLLNDLAWFRATSADDATRDGVEALRLAQALNSALGGKNANVLDTLAAAQAELGQFDQALATIDQAIQLAQATGNGELARAMTQRRELYAAGQPYRLAPR